MSMVVKNNIAAQLTLGELNKNITKLGKALAKVSSGEKITGAKDDASNYAISEKMREQIRSLTQDNQNVQNGSSLFRIAEGGINNIVEELRNLKELAINAANDTNTDVDRLTMQKEFQQKMANINDIATMTNYNGKILLDGRYHKPSTGTSASDSTDSDSTKFKSVFKEVSEPTGATQIISGTNFTITSDGVYEIASGFTGKINVNAQNVKITQANPSTALNNVEIIGPSGGNANLWIENLNITTNTVNSSIISFKGADNVLTVRGNNTLRGTNGGSYAIIFTGSGVSTDYTALNVQGDNTSTLDITMSQNYAKGAGIGVNDGYGGNTTGEINIVNLNLTSSGMAQSSLVGTGFISGHVGNITIENSKFNLNSNSNVGHVGIGARGSNSSAGDILIVSSEINTINVNTTIGAGTNDGGASCNCGTITIQDSKIDISGNAFYGIGKGDANGIFATDGVCGNISISASTINAECYDNYRLNKSFHYRR